MRVHAPAAHPAVAPVAPKAVPATPSVAPAPAAPAAPSAAPGPVAVKPAAPAVVPAPSAAPRPTPAHPHRPAAPAGQPAAARPAPSGAPPAGRPSQPGTQPMAARPAAAASGAPARTQVPSRPPMPTGNRGPVPGTVPGSGQRPERAATRTAHASATIRTRWAAIYLAHRRSRWPRWNRPFLWTETRRGTGGIASRPTHARPARDVAAISREDAGKGGAGQTALCAETNAAPAPDGRQTGDGGRAQAPSDAPTAGCRWPRRGRSHDCAAGTSCPARSDPDRRHHHPRIGGKAGHPREGFAEDFAGSRCFREHQPGVGRPHRNGPGAIV